MRQKILITGASSGLGRGAAIGLAKAGHRVTAGAETWQQVTTLREDAAEAGAKLTVIKLDLLSEIDLAHAATLDVDILVLNAGVQETGSLVDIPLELVRKSFEINVFAHLDLAQRIIPSMIKRKSGKVVWVSSQAGLYAPPFMGAYAATKHAIEALASTMKAELNLFGIGVATINPGLFRTGYNETGAETHAQWSHLKDVLIPMPPAGPLLALQHDPQPMIDAMVEAIPDRKGAYRTMGPEDAVVETKITQELGWTQKAR
ncbi:MAG: SDR family oxidoreductase [Rhodoglobus sp.]